MLTIPEQQVIAWIERSRRSFEHEAYAFLKRRFARECKAWGEERVRRTTESGVRDAVGRGITARGDVLRYLSLMFALAPDFDNGDRYPWVRHILADPALAAHAKMDQLCRLAHKALETRYEDAPPGTRRLDKALHAACRAAERHPREDRRIGPVTTHGRDWGPCLTPVRVSLLEGDEAYLDVAPGLGRGCLVLHAAGTPEGGTYAWEADPEDAAILTSHGATAWLRPRVLGRVAVTVRYGTAASTDRARIDVHVRPAPRIRITPAHIDFGETIIGEKVPVRKVTIANIGGREMALRSITLPKGFALAGRDPSGAVLSPDGRITFQVSFQGGGPGRHAGLLKIVSDAANRDESSIPVKARAAYPRPVLELVATPVGEPLGHVAIGPWDRAWNPADGNLYNGEGEEQNFIGRDSNRFFIRVTDRDAADRGEPNVRVRWWTRRDRDRAGENLPRDAAITLTRHGDTACYVSSSVMLVTDGDDYRQATHGGPHSAGLLAAGFADHRLRELIIDERDRLDRHVYVEYGRGRTELATTTVPIFQREPEIRKSLTLEIVNVRNEPGGKPAADSAYLEACIRSLRAIFARCGIYVGVNVTEVDPPPAATGWAEHVEDGGDASVSAAYRDDTSYPPRWVPSPSQLDLIRSVCLHPDHVYLFFLGNIYHALASASPGSVSFYPGGERTPSQPARACRGLNLQHTARTLAHYLCPNSRRYARKPWSARRRAQLKRALAFATRAAVEVGGKDETARARAFLAALDGIRDGKSSFPGYVREAIAQARDEVHPAYYKPSTLDALIQETWGRGFLSESALRCKYTPAHELAHILLDLDDETGGHFDLEIPLTRARENTPGYDIPGRIDGRNLMHRYVLRDQSDPVEDPKRLWDREFVNLSREVEAGGLVIPAQITTIRANETYLKPYKEPKDV